MNTYLLYSLELQLAEAIAALDEYLDSLEHNNPKYVQLLLPF